MSRATSSDSWTLGENKNLASNYWAPNPSFDNPSNRSNDLLTVMKEEYPGARNINNVTQVLEPLRAWGIEGRQGTLRKWRVRGFSARASTRLNSELGYISLKSALNTDEVLAVAYEYTYNGKVYQVGESSRATSLRPTSRYT